MAEIDKNIEEIQFLEQNLQNILVQKQAFQLELSETSAALEEIEKSKEEEVFKIIGQLMIKVEKQKSINELSEKKKIIELRLKSIEKQENSLSERIESIREEMMHSSSEGKKRK